VRETCFLHTLEAPACQISAPQELKVCKIRLTYANLGSYRWSVFRRSMARFVWDQGSLRTATVLAPTRNGLRHLARR
jgi:hypothetical protein